MSVDLKFMSTSKASRKSTTNDSQYFTVFLQAVLNYRALVRTEHIQTQQQGSNCWAFLVFPECKKELGLQTLQQTPFPHLTFIPLKYLQSVLPAAGWNCKSREFAWKQQQQDNPKSLAIQKMLWASRKNQISSQNLTGTLNEKRKSHSPIIK